MKLTKDMVKGDWKAIKDLISKGVPDAEISRKLNISTHVVQKASTNYWKHKMNQKDES